MQPRVAILADEMQDLVEEFSIEQGRTACRWFRGWAQARQGRPREGHRLIREAYEQSSRLGMRAGASEVLGYATEALLLAGDCEGAQVQLQEAQEVADELGERVYLPQLWLLEAALARAQGHGLPARPAPGAPSRRRGRRSRPGSSCSRSSTWASTMRWMPRNDKPWKRSSIGCREAHDTPAVSKARLMLAKT